MGFIRICFVLVLLPTLALCAELPGSLLVVGSDFAAQDTLECGPEDNADARDCLGEPAMGTGRVSRRTRSG